MDNLSLRVYPDPVLREKALPILEFDEDLNELIRGMEATLYEMGGIGLAAPQVGVSARIIIVDTGEGIFPLVNPEILERRGIKKALEGCLSLPDLELDIERAETIKVAAQHPDGNRFEIDCSELLSRVIQHEIDHLEARLIIDRISVIKKQLIKNSLKKMRDDWQRPKRD